MSAATMMLRQRHLGFVLAPRYRSLARSSISFFSLNKGTIAMRAVLPEETTLAGAVDTAAPGKADIYYLCVSFLRFL